MIQNSANINILWAGLIIEELVRHGVTLFCISPGSRSTPLTIAAVTNKTAETLVALDERSGAFYALGYARARHRPAALICTSGTALANYYPAVIEAYQSRVPLIILSADRPPELRNTGANQTIDQVGIYGAYTNWTIDLPAPDTTINPRFILTSVDQAVFQAIKRPSGPVQINCMFREPLEPKPVPYPESYLDDIRSWQEDQEPWTDYLPSKNILNPNELAGIADRLNTGGRTLLVVGRTGDPDAKERITDLAIHTGWPVFADITSGLRATRDQMSLIDYYDLLLASERFKRLLKSYRILHIGDPLTSKRFLQFITQYPSVEYYHLHDHHGRQDPAHVVKKRIVADISEFCSGLKPLLNRHDQDNMILALNQQAGNTIGNFSEQESILSEISVAIQIAGLVPANQGLHLGNSMPVRDFDMIGRIKNPNVVVSANRGASGIDGSIASAAGFARGIAAPVTAVIGDLAFLHDLNALDLINKTANRIILVVINNNGGGIFSFLPIAQYKEVFEPFFATPHDLRFEHAARMYGLKYTVVTDGSSFQKAYQTALDQDHHSIIEVQTNREENYTMHRNLLSQLIEKVEHLMD